MTTEQMIEFINSKLAYVADNGYENNMKLSAKGEASVRERFKKSESDGGYSEYWKNITLEELRKSAKLNP